MKYNFTEIEKKWQKVWEDKHVFEASADHSKPKFYGLVEFPYPSGAGMHVGHIKAYSGLEVVSRKRRMQGYNVMFPIGFDAYGLPTENYAINADKFVELFELYMKLRSLLSFAIIYFNNRKKEKKS